MKAAEIRFREYQKTDMEAICCIIQLQVHF